MLDIKYEQLITKGRTAKVRWKLENWFRMPLEQYKCYFLGVEATVSFCAYATEKLGYITPNMALRTGCTWKTLGTLKTLLAEHCCIS
jgi:hypothetical protein